jgi:hypothetical protein
LAHALYVHQDHKPVANAFLVLMSPTFKSLYFNIPNVNPW